MTIMQVSRRMSISYEIIYSLLENVKAMPRMAKKRLGRLRNKRGEVGKCKNTSSTK